MLQQPVKRFIFLIIFLIHAPIRHLLSNITTILSPIIWTGHPYPRSHYAFSNNHSSLYVHATFIVSCISPSILDPPTYSLTPPTTRVYYSHNLHLITASLAHHIIHRYIFAYTLPRSYHTIPQDPLPFRNVLPISSSSAHIVYKL